LSPLYVLDTNPPSNGELAKIFCRLSLYSGNRLLCDVETFKFDAIPLVNSWSYFLSYWSYIKKVIAIPISCLEYFPYILLHVKTFLQGFWSYNKIVDPFYIDFLYNIRDGDLVSVFYIWISNFFSATFVEEAVFSLTWAFGAYVKIQMTVALFTCFWALYYISLAYMSLLYFISLYVTIVSLPCYNVIWIQVLWYLQSCFFCSGLFWLLMIFILPSEF
jgi:hypothetical protein